MSGIGNPLALQANFTVEPLRTVKLLLGCNEEITGGTEKKHRKNAWIFFYNGNGTNWENGRLNGSPLLVQILLKMH